MKRRAFVLFGSVLVAGLATTPAWAERPDFTQKHGKAHMSESFNERHDRDDEIENIHPTIVLDESRRAKIQDYFRNKHARACPPGLAKKRNGCLPPGQAKKYSIGGTLPSDYRALPPDLIDLLGPPPPGAFYSLVDNDIVLAAKKTKKVLDAIAFIAAP